MKKTRVALVLSGGISAGSYIAGALDELLRAFQASNEYEIDIITGGSAGSTTAALIAHGLCHRNGETDLHRVWLDKVDIVELLDPNVCPSDPLSVLSSSLQRRLIEQTIRWPEDGGPGIRAGFCSPDLIVAMTLGNSTALPYISRVHQPTPGGEEKFVQERNAEQETFRLNNDVGPKNPIWERIGSVALASSAVPFIFPMVQLARTAGDRNHYVVRPEFDGTRRFWYYDGGTYNNLPVDLVWHYITEVANAQQADPLQNRRVIVVNPWRSESAPIPDNLAYPDLLTHAFTMLRNIRTEGSSIQFDNEVVRLSDDLHQTNSLVRAIPGVDRPPVDLLRTFALVIPHLHTPPLRCLYLNHFSAFLDRKFREYDFRRGAADARRVAKVMLKIAVYDERPEEFYEPDNDANLRVDIRHYKALGSIQSTRHPGRSVRDVFENAVEQRVRALVRRADLPGPNNPLTDAIVTRMIMSEILKRLPSLWNDVEEQRAVPPAS
jgi:predicted acylesterase/phospholipase RssA